MILKNLTTHPIVLIGEDGTEVTILPSGTVARCAETTEEAGVVDVGQLPIRRVRNTFGAVSGLPDPAPHTLYLVSSLVGEAAHRADVVAPADLVRDESGRVVGARALAVFV